MSVDYAEIYRLAKLGKQSEQRSEALGGCLGALTWKAFADLTTGWMFMLAVDVAHTHWWSAVPTIGYWWAVLIVLLTRGMFGTTGSKSKTNK